MTVILYIGLGFVLGHLIGHFRGYVSGFKLGKYAGLLEGKMQTVTVLDGLKSRLKATHVSTPDMNSN